MSLYLKTAGNDKTAPHIDHAVEQIVRELSLVYCLPSTPFKQLFRTKKLSGIISIIIYSVFISLNNYKKKIVQETTYSYVTWIFCQHFLNRLGSEYEILSKVLNQNDPSHMGILDKIKKRLRDDTFTSEYVLSILLEYPQLIKLCYVNFAVSHHINTEKIRKKSLK